MRKIGEVLKEGAGAVPVQKFINLAGFWRSAMTENISKVTTPVKITGGTLLVLVHDGIWLTELNYMKEEIVERLNGRGLPVKTINFKSAPSFVKYEKPRKKPNEITDREIFYIEKFAETIDNKKLKNSFKGAMRAYFTRHTFEEFINGNS